MQGKKESFTQTSVSQASHGGVPVDCKFERRGVVLSLTGNQISHHAALAAFLATPTGNVAPLKPFALGTGTAALSGVTPPPPVPPVPTNAS